ncbi:MAG: isoprenylcysteine carboxylmethyltransferase family protein [Rhodothermaceae bacterium]|nr:isoprenylcysteine carboxylmethyltransferase family protein [Rhodothermaceae bacterium]
MAHSAPDSPGVPFPPPFLFALGFGGGLLLHRLMPVSSDTGFGFGIIVLAWALVLAGALLLGWALWTFFSARTAIVPNRPATDLLTRGPYGFSRNPMYVALTAMYIGLALWATVLWPLVLLPGVLTALWLLVIRREEAYLTRAFGVDYMAYSARVRRWL